MKERKKLQRVEPLTLVEYIQTSIEILMQLKSEEARAKEDINKKESRIKSLLEGVSSPQALSGDQEPPAEYEKLIVKLESEVRNHIKIEQQLKLHIECL